MLIFIIVVIVIVVSIAAITSENNNKGFNDNSNTLNNIGNTEMMSDMYKDITGRNLDPIEKSILFMHNKNKK